MEEEEDRIHRLNLVLSFSVDEKKLNFAIFFFGIQAGFSRFFCYNWHSEQT